MPIMIVIGLVPLQDSPVPTVSLLTTTTRNLIPDYRPSSGGPYALPVAAETARMALHRVEAQLAHKDAGVSGIYNLAVYLPQRRAMMQWYADYLDCLVDSMTPAQRADFDRCVIVAEFKRA